MDVGGNPIRTPSPSLGVGRMSQSEKFVLFAGRLRAAIWRVNILRADLVRLEQAPRESTGPTLFSDLVTAPWLGMISRIQSPHPRIYDWNGKVFKVGYVARCKSGVACEGDTRDHRIAQFDGTPLLVA
jgi:hypothetical protein